MAKQHFYSRVPAKVSLFNKMDGYDTFAHSSGISREQIEKTLSLIYDNKPSKDDDAKILNNELPPFYAQITGANGETVQSSYSFISSDYTGERSSYMVHSLVLSNEEKESIIYSLNSKFLNKDVFEHTLDKFDLTSFESKPDTNYPEINVLPVEAEDCLEITKSFDTGMLKRLIFTLLSICCGKTKAVYLSLSSDLSSLSTDCLSFLNSFLQIFPFHMRDILSFVTYTGDIAKFSSFKIKCIPENTPEIPVSKGITIHLGAKDYYGITDESIIANAMVVDFFYDLLSNDKMRRDFIGFCDYAVKQNESLRKPSWKNITDLVLLFKCLSGYFNEEKTLPNDNAVYDFISVYEKNRNSLTDDYKSRSMKCLCRYSATGSVIPKNVFTKVSNIYASEIKESRSIVMDVVLKLIHTDAMRDKLFVFIKNNYDNEDGATKERIMQDLCRVYYGGFLQSKLIEFFAEKFRNEPDSTRMNIVERLLLTIRTPKIQDEVIAFFDEFFGELKKSEKEKFYQTFIEMLPVGDELSGKLALIVDKNIDDESKAFVSEKIIEIVEADERHHEPKVCGVLAVRCGFCESVLAKKIFSDWTGRKILDEYISFISGKTVNECVDSIIEIFELVSSVEKSVLDRLYDGLSQNLSKNRGVNFFVLIDSIDKLNELKNKVPSSLDFVSRLSSEILEPMAGKLIPTVFDNKKNPDGIDRFNEILGNNPFLKNCPEFSTVECYAKILDSIKRSSAIEILDNSFKIDNDEIKPIISGLIKKEINDKLSFDVFLSLNICVDYLKNGAVNLVSAGNSLRDLIAKSERNGENANAKSDVINKISDDKSIECVLKFVSDLFNLPVLEEIKKLFCSSNGISDYASLYIKKYDKKGKKYLSELIKAVGVSDEIKNEVERSFNTGSNGGFFSKLFKK